jgi:hypothetical protein
MTGNVLADNDYRDWGTKQTNYALSGNGPMDVEGNWWQMGDMDTGATNVTVTGNHVIGMLSDAPSSIVDNAGLEPAFRGLLDRRYGTGVPDAPSQVAVSAGNGFAYVSWAPPVDDGGSPVTAYVVRSASGHSTTVSASQFRSTGCARLSGLTNGTADSFTVSARNADGTGASAIPSRVVTPNAAAVSVPTTPRNVSAVVGDGRVTIRFGLPSSNGGSPITSYTVKGGGKTVHVTGRTILVLTGGSHFHYGVGQVGIATSQTINAQFDNLSVTAD